MAVVSYLASSAVATNGVEHITARNKGATSKKKVMAAHETKEPRQKDFCFAVVCYRLLRSLVFMESDNRWGNRKTIKSFKKVDRGCEYAGWTIVSSFVRPKRRSPGLRYLRAGVQVPGLPSTPLAHVGRGRQQAHQGGVGSLRRPAERAVQLRPLGEPPGPGVHGPRTDHLALWE